MKANNLTITYTPQGKAILTISLADKIKMDKLTKLAESDKDLDIELDFYRTKRSKDSNSYLWVLLQKMADVLGESKDNIYITMLDRYGECIHATMPTNAVESFRESYRYIRELDTVTSNGKEVAHVLLFKGSSTYNSKQMSLLLNGVVSECQELEIETVPQQEIDRLISMIGK